MMPQAAMPSRMLEPSPADAGHGGLRIHTPSLRPMAFPEPPGPAAGGIKPLAYLKYRWVLVLFLGGFLAAGFAYAAWSLIPSKYTTYSMARVHNSEQVLYTKEEPNGRNDFAIYLKSQAAMIKSNFVLTSALRDPNVAALPMLREQSDPIRFLEEELKVESQDGSEVFKILLSGDDPRAIAQIVNAVHAAYFREVVDEEVNRKKSRLKQLEDLINRMQDEVERRREQMKQADVATPSTDTIPGVLNISMLAGQLARHKDTLTKIENDTVAWEQEKTSFEKRLANVAEEVPAPGAAYLESLENDAHMQALKKKVESMNSKIAFLIKASNDPKMPSVVELQHKVAEAQKERDLFKKERVDEYHKNTLPSVEKKLKDDLERAKNNLAQLAIQKTKAQETIAEFQKSLGQSGGSDPPDTFQQIDVRERAKIITEMMDKANLLRLEVNAPPRVSDFQRASVPLKKDMKKQTIGTILAGLMGFGFVGLGVIVYESRVRRALSLADVQTAVLGPVAGVWPESDDDARANVGADSSSEAVEKTRAHLLQQFGQPGPRVIAVTSALTDEGKGDLACQLAQSFAGAGSRTLLVDFDLRSPGLHRLLKVDNERGLCEILTQKNELREVVLPLPNGLMFLPAGKWSADVRFGLSPEKLATALQSLRLQFDVVVICTHPVLKVAESFVLCRQADGILLSVERHETRLPMAARAHERLATAGSEAFGLVYQGATPEECLR